MNSLFLTLIFSLLFSMSDVNDSDICNIKLKLSCGYYSCAIQAPAKATMPLGNDQAAQATQLLPWACKTHGSLLNWKVNNPWSIPSGLPNLPALRAADWKAGEKTWDHQQHAHCGAAPASAATGTNFGHQNCTKNASPTQGKFSSTKPCTQHLGYN